jgi:uncharacterized membrane protein
MSFKLIHSLKYGGRSIPEVSHCSGILVFTSQFPHVTKAASLSLVTLYGSQSSCLSNHSSNAFNTSVKGIAVSCHTLPPTMQVTRTMRSTVAIITVQQIHEIAEETPQQYSEGHHHFSSSQAKTCMTKMRVVITL